MNIIQSYDLNRGLEQFNLILQEYKNHEILLKEKDEEKQIYTFENGDQWKIFISTQINKYDLTTNYYYLDSTLFDIQDIKKYYDIEGKCGDHMIFF